MKINSTRKKGEHKFKETYFKLKIKMLKLLKVMKY